MSGQIINQQSEKGFTIIEVVLVLAIAGLIFAAVFIALPALQKAQRDSHRKTDVGLTVAAVRNYMVDNKNRPPSDSGQTSTGDYFDMDGDGEISNAEKELNWVDGSPSEDLAPYIREITNSGVTTTVTVFDVTNVSSLYVTSGNTDKAGLITVFLGAKCPTTYPRPNVMSMGLTHVLNDIAVFRYLENGKNYCEDF